jgi:hypothetical protein
MMLAEKLFLYGVLSMLAANAAHQEFRWAQEYIEISRAREANEAARKASLERSGQPQRRQSVWHFQPPSRPVK